VGAETKTRWLGGGPSSLQGEKSTARRWIINTSKWLCDQNRANTPSLKQRNCDDQKKVTTMRMQRPLEGGAAKAAKGVVKWNVGGRGVANEK